MRLASLACNRREAAPSAESHLAILYASVRHGSSVGGKDMGAPSRLRRSNSGSSTAVGNPTLLPRVAAADRLAIGAELKQSLMELLTGRHALVRRVHTLVYTGISYSYLLSRSQCLSIFFKLAHTLCLLVILSYFVDNN